MAEMTGTGSRGGPVDGMDGAHNYLHFSRTRGATTQPRRYRRSRGGDGIPAFFLYGEPLQPPDERLIHVERIAARSKLHEWKIHAHRHRDLNQILLIHRGHVVIRLDDARLSLDPPVLVSVPSGTVHSFTFEPRTTGLVISFAPALIRELAGSGTGMAEWLERPHAQSLKRRSVLETDLGPLGEMLLRESMGSALGRQSALRGLLSAMLANVLRLGSLSPEPEFGAKAQQTELVTRFRRLIEERYRTHMGVAAYATELGVPETKLRRACLAAVGQSPVELLHLRLLVEAERQLRYTTVPVADVAYYLGFNDPAYFSRFFTRRAQVSPRAFRSRDPKLWEAHTLPPRLPP